MARGELLGTVILAGNCRGSAIIGWGCGAITQGTIIRERGEQFSSRAIALEPFIINMGDKFSYIYLKTL